MALNPPVHKTAVGAYQEERVTAGSLCPGDHVMVPGRPSQVMRIEEVKLYAQTVQLTGVMTNGGSLTMNRFRTGPLVRVVWTNIAFRAQFDKMIDKMKAEKASE